MSLPLSLSAIPRIFKKAGAVALFSSALLTAPSLVGLSMAAAEQAVVPGADLHSQAPKRGWFWYREPVGEEEGPVKEVIQVAPEAAAPMPAPEQPTVVIAPPSQPEESLPMCESIDTWSASCGFIDPGEDFDFQAKQRDELLQMMSLRPDNPEAVEAAQRYMKWVVGKASMAANMWYFNMTQNPDLDPTVKNPISEVGLALASRVETASSREYFQLMQEEGGVLFYITRDDCIYCHDQQRATQRVAKTMGLPLINVPIDGICLEGFEGETCGDNVTQEQIAVLDVHTVPTLFLHIPDSTWIRLGTGVVSDDRIMANTVNFFSAYRAAIIAGLDNGEGTRPSVSFDPELRPLPTGTSSASGEYHEALPDQDTMLDLLGMQKSN